MKKVFLIGDSIRLGYEKYVSQELGAEAQVFSSPDNARFTTYTMRYIHEWAAMCPDADIVHWNNGLWDAGHFNGDPQSLITLDNYLSNLRRIRTYISTLFPKARVIFALTTPVDSGHPRNRNGEIEEMNRGAVRVLSHDTLINPAINQIVRANPGFIRPEDHVHMVEEGYQVLGKAVADFIRKNW